MSFYYCLTIYDNNSFQGRFTIAAKHHVSIAEIYESELADMDKAIQSYKQAADYFKGEESHRYHLITKNKLINAPGLFNFMYCFHCGKWIDK